MKFNFILILGLFSFIDQFLKAKKRQKKKVKISNFYFKFCKSSKSSISSKKKKNVNLKKNVIIFVIVTKKVLNEKKKVGTKKKQILRKKFYWFIFVLLFSKLCFPPKLNFIPLAPANLIILLNDFYSKMIRKSSFQNSNSSTRVQNPFPIHEASKGMYAL